MKKIIYKGTIEESDYNRVKDIDSENYITPDGKTVLPKLAQMPLRDLAILSFTSENELKKYYTGNEEYFSYSVVELMLDTRIQTSNLSRHKVSSFEDALYLLYNYSEEIPQADDPKYLSILIAADILNGKHPIKYTIKKGCISFQVKQPSMVVSPSFFIPFFPFVWQHL